MSLSKTKSLLLAKLHLHQAHHGFTARTSENKSCKGVLSYAVQHFMLKNHNQDTDFLKPSAESNNLLESNSADPNAP